MPAQDEATRLPRTLAALAEEPFLRSRTYELIVVDDGSQDDTALLALRFAHAPVRVLRVEGRRGVGIAARTGMLAARGARVLFCDADGAVPFGYVELLWRALDGGFDLAIGSRQMAPGSIV